MTAAHRQRFRAHTAAVREDLHQGTITLGGIPYACAATTGKITEELDPTTMTTRNIQQAHILVRRSVLTTAPSLSARVLYNGLEWFISDLGEPAENWSLTLKRIIKKNA